MTSTGTSSSRLMFSVPSALCLNSSSGACWLMLVRCNTTKSYCSRPNRTIANLAETLANPGNLLIASSSVQTMRRLSPRYGCNKITAGKYGRERSRRNGFAAFVACNVYGFVDKGGSHAQWRRRHWSHRASTTIFV